MLVARASERLEEVAQECLQRGAATAVTRPADVGDEQAVDEIFADTVERLGRVDQVIHSAGVAAYGTFADVPSEILAGVWQTNVMGTAHVGRAALRQFTAQGGGHAIFVGSLLGKIVTPQMSPYTSSKWAVHALVRTMQIEARQLPGVAISLVSPGGVNSPIYAWAASASGRQGQPPPPVDTAEKVARVIMRLLDRPRREASVGLANPVIVLGFRAMPAIYDRLVTPMMGVFGLLPGTVPTSAGNVFDSKPAPSTSYGDDDPAPVRVVRRLLNSAAAAAARVTAR